MKRKILLVGILTLLVSSVLSICVSSADYSRIEDYVQNQFGDVTEEAWYAQDVETAYSLGLMQGVSDDTFAPDDYVAVAQGITLAAKLNASYYSRTVTQSTGDEWYEAYVDYAIANGIIQDGQFSDYDRDIKRYEIAQLFCNALPSSSYTAIRNVDNIPDVVDTATYKDAVEMLYNAGVLSGSNEYGYFYPEESLTRAQCAVIINHIVLPETRTSQSIEVFVDKAAYLIADEESVNNPFMVSHIGNKADSKEVINSAWRYDNRGGPIRLKNKASYKSLVDISEEFGTALIRDLAKIDSGRVVTEAQVTTASNGVFLEFRDEDDNVVYSVKTVGGDWKILLANGTYQTILSSALTSEEKLFNFRIVMDFDTEKVSTYINGTNCGIFDLLSDNIINFRFATDEPNTPVAIPGSFKMTANYLMEDSFNLFGIDSVYNWQKTGNAIIENKELKLSGTASVQNSFEQADGRIVANALFINENSGNFDFVLSGNNEEVAKVSAINGKLVVYGKEIYTLSTKMWYRLRLDVNTQTGVTDVLLNGRSVGKFNTTVGAVIDKIKIVNSTGTNKFDNVNVSRIMDYPDYVPIPETKASYDDYVVGLNVCSIWRTGSHQGWGCITPFDEREPVLGYYDEPSPEAADWEIKFMVEHGIDFQAFCWYPSGGEEPLKYNDAHEQLHSGYMYSRYSDYMDYCIIWEASTTNTSKNIFDLTYFKNYVVPYWFENYFLDDRYVKIDNHILLCMFGGANIYKTPYFGSVAGAKEAMDYLDEVAQSYGFDGVITLSNESVTTAASNFSAIGIEGYYSYGWGSAGNTLATNQLKNQEAADIGAESGFYAVPTVTPGFDSVPWHSVRYGRISVEEWDDLQDWVVDEYLATNAKIGDEWAWTNNFVFTSTWNEYGEGSYLMPDCSDGRGSVGFQYLDSLRNHYTDLPAEHVDVVPTASQRARINKTFPQYQTLLIPHGWYQYEFSGSIPEEHFELEHIIDFKNKANVAFSVSRGSTSINTDVTNVLSVTATGNDPQINIYDMFDSDGIDYIRVNMKTPKPTPLKVYWTTYEDTTWGAKAVSAQVDVVNQMTAVLLPVSQHKDWKDRITGILLDFGGNGFVGDAFEFESVEFLKYNSTLGAHLYIDGIDVVSEVPCIVENGVVYSPFDQQTSIHYLLDGVYTYNSESGEFVFEANHNKLEFTVGSNKYKLNGTQKDLGYTLELVDGVPMFDFASFATDLGYTVTKSGQNVYIETPQKSLVEDALESDFGNWTFDDTSRNLKGWYCNEMDLFVTEDGTVKGISDVNKNRDPNIQLKNLSFPAAKYKAIEVRLRYKHDGSNNDTIKIYYTTDKSTTADEYKRLYKTLSTNDTGTEYVTYTFDTRISYNTSNDVCYWQDNITYLRFDPFNAHGVVEIDYIKLIEDENYVEPTESPAITKIPLTIINGNAEGETIDFTTAETSGIYCNIVEETTADGGTNHFYRVSRSSQADTSGTYMHMTKKPIVMFENGDTYSISYKARVVGDTAGNTNITTTVNLNLGYYDTSKLQLSQYTNIRNKDHDIGKRISCSDGWVTITKEFTISNMSTIMGNVLQFYSYPVDGRSVIFDIDDIVIEKIN